MSRLETCADFARILLDDFESAEKVCESKSSLSLTKHELIVRRLNTHMEMERYEVTEAVQEMRDKYAHGQNETLKRIGREALEGTSIPNSSELAVAYYQAQAKVSVLDELIEKINSSEDTGEVKSNYCNGAVHDGNSTQIAQIKGGSISWHLKENT